MTIGIAATGARAGAAIRAALEMAERIGAGDIGGFVAFAAITADDRLLRCETQSGGIAAAIARAEAEGTRDAILAAPVAALMSSGPDRPEPLSQFVPGDAAIGLVSGHRRPDLPGPDGRAINLHALELLGDGLSPDAAIRAALDRMPEIDAGLLAVRPGEVAAADSARVLRRPDRGMALRSGPGGRAVGVVHNSIRPVAGLADLVAGIAFEALAAEDSERRPLALAPGTPIAAGKADIVEIDEENTIRRITTSNPHLSRAPRWTSAAVYLGSEVRRAGARLGRTTGECRARIEDGRIVEIEGCGEIPWQADDAS